MLTKNAKDCLSYIELAGNRIDKKFKTLICNETKALINFKTKQETEKRL